MCDICRGHSNCPVCSEEPVYAKCEDCGGTGIVYYTEYGLYISKEHYDALPPSERFSEKCENCDGDGRIEVEYYEFEE